MTATIGKDRLGAAVGLAIVLLCGCANLDWRRPIPWRSASERKTETPVKLVGNWNEAILRTPGQRPVRGFGGRVLFYGQQNGHPIEVDGSVVVYAFEESGRDSGSAAPDRKFVFPAHLLEKHFSESKLGPSYSFWLPWDEVGGERKEISLIVRFEPEEGPVIVGAQSKNLLPGTAPIAETSAPADQTPSGSSVADTGVSTDAVKPAGFSQPPDNHTTLGIGGQPSGEQMITTTISLPARTRTAAPTFSRLINPLWQQNARVGMPADMSGATGATIGSQRALSPLSPRSQTPVPRATRSGLPRSPAPSRPAFRPLADRAGWPPLRARSPSHPAAPLQTAFQNGQGERGAAAAATGR